MNQARGRTLQIDFGKSNLGNFANDALQQQQFFVLTFFEGHEINESALTVFLISMLQPQCPFNCVGDLKVCYLDSVLNLKEG